MSTKQIHPYVVDYEKSRKILIRSHKSGKPILHHTRKWWKAWHRTWWTEHKKQSNYFPK